MFSLSTKTLLFILLTVFTVNAKLFVRKPTTLEDQFDKVKGIDYTVLTPQNKITYKRMFIGNLMLPSNISACEYIDPISSTGDLYVSNPVLLVTWGDCHYEQKVRNAEVAGAKMLLLVLKHDMQLNHPAVRQLQLDSSIQVLAISATDGNKLMKYLEDTQNTMKGDYDAVVEIKYSYEIEKHIGYKKGETGEIVNIDFWFISGDETKQSYEVLFELSQLIPQFGDKINFFPHYVLWKNENLEMQGYNMDDKRCIAGGRYCDPEPENGKKLFGSQSVLEDLRQMCYRNLNLNKNQKITTDSYWWKYVRAFGDNCADLDMDQIDACRNKMYSNAEIPSSIVNEVDACMKSSFIGDASGDLTKVRKENKILQAEMGLKDGLQIDYYPALYMNGERYQGSYRNSIMLQDFICTHFTTNSMPSVCTAIVVTTEPSDPQGDFFFYALIVVVSVVVMATMLYCVRRTVKRQVMGRMNEEISHIVTQYKQFKDKSTTGDDDL